MVFALERVKIHGRM